MIGQPPSAPRPASRPSRVRLQRRKGWRMPPGAIKVDRSTVYGNPFVPGEDNGLGWGVVRDVAHAVWLYRQWLATPARSIVYEADRHRAILLGLPALAGHDLACWCVAGGTCHADVLLKLANRPDIAQVAALLLGGWTEPRSAVEYSIVAGQLGRLTGMTPAEVENLGSTVLTLLEQQRRRRAGGEEVIPSG